MPKSPQTPQRPQRPNQTPNPPPKKGWDAVTLWTAVVGVFTGLLFLANAVGLFFIEEQWHIANQAQSDSREQLRALVSQIGGLTFPANLKDGHPSLYGFMPKFHNYGATRTSTFKQWVSVHYFDGEVPNSQDFSKPWNRVDIVDAIVPGGVDVQSVPVTITPEDATRAMDKKGVIVIWGHVDWADIFDPNKIHPISYCLKMVPIIGADGNLAFQPVPLRADCNSSS